MSSVNSTKFSTGSVNTTNSTRTNKQQDINKSIFEKNDTDGYVNDEDFVGYEEIGKKVKLMNYFGLKWNQVRNIINGLFNNDEKKFGGNLDVFSNDMKFENQILVKNISTAQTLEEAKQDLTNKGVNFNLQNNVIMYEQDGFNIEIRMNTLKGHEHEVMTTITKDGKLLQKIFSAPTVRSGSGVKEIENYNDNGKMTTYAQYNDNGIYLMNVYNTSDKSKKVRYAVSRDNSSVNIVKDGTTQKYDKNGKPINKS